MRSTDGTVLIWHGCTFPHVHYETCDTQLAVPKRTISHSAIRAHNPERCQSSLCLATDDLYHLPLSAVSVLHFSLLSFSVCLSLSLLWLASFCLPLHHILLYSPVILSASLLHRAFAAHLLALHFPFYPRSILLLLFSIHSKASSHLLLPSVFSLQCCCDYLRHRSHYAVPACLSFPHLSLHYVSLWKCSGRLQPVQGHLLADLTGT